MQDGKAERGTPHLGFMLQDGTVLQASAAARSGIIGLFSVSIHGMKGKAGV
jgi:hypothetical protein